jgi:glycerophosphoryl diester phosphodiesterase
MRMWVIAHRGGGALFPENTLTAFTQSEALGVDMVECDVHLSRDGELMVIHDATLSRTGNTPVRISELTAQEAAAIDVGGGEGVPMLTTLLDCIAIPVVIEIKTETAVYALASLLQRRPELIARVVPISFYHRAVLALADQFADLQVGVLLAGVPVHLGQVARDAHARIVSLEYEMVNADLVEALHAENLLVTVWTPNTREEIHNLVAAGVDGIASDRPDWVLEAVGRR